MTDESDTNPDDRSEAGLRTQSIILARPGERLPGTPYVLTSRLGGGGMGQVFRAEHVELGREVAVKLLAPTLAHDPKAMERLRREARAAAQLGNPHIIDVYDLGITDDGRPYVVMKLVNGRDLKVLADAEGPLSPERTVALVEQLGDALKVAHAAGVVHRDLKPENVLVERRADADVVTILDFGIAQSIRDTDTRLTRDGQMIGTPGYMAPEQALARPLDGRADQYALAVMTYELLSGTSPFARLTPLQLIAAQLTEEPAHLGSVVDTDRVPAAMVEVVMRGMARDPDARYPTIGEFVEALSRSLDGGAASVAAAPAPAAAASGGGPSSGVALAAAVVLLGLGVGAWFALSGADEGADPLAGARVATPVTPTAAADPSTPAETPPPGPADGASAADPPAVDPEQTPPEEASPGATGAALGASPAKVEPAQVEPAKVEPAKVEPAEPEPRRRRTTRRTTPKPEPVEPTPAPVEPVEPPEPSPVEPTPDPTPPEPAPVEPPPDPTPAAPVDPPEETPPPEPPPPPAGPPELVFGGLDVVGGASTRQIKRTVSGAFPRIESCVAAIGGRKAGQSATVGFVIDADGFFLDFTQRGDKALGDCATKVLRRINRLGRRPDTGDIRVSLPLRLEAR